MWDPTQMYNHITNNWGDKPHEIPFDVRQEASGLFAREYLVQWLKDNPDTDVVRFTRDLLLCHPVFPPSAGVPRLFCGGVFGLLSLGSLRLFLAVVVYR